MKFGLNLRECGLAIGYAKLAHVWRTIMTIKKTIFTIIILAFGLAFAQQQVTLAGVVKTVDEIPENTKVAVFTVNSDNAWQREIATTAVVAGTFSITTSNLEPSELTAFANGSSALLPGLQNEYTISPANIAFARAIVNVYVDSNGNNAFDNIDIDKPFIGIASLDNPVGFYSLLYVNQDAQITGKGQVLDLKAGWNIFTIRFPTESEGQYAIETELNDALLDVFLAE